jgi:hypothetical protein
MMALCHSLDKQHCLTDDGPLVAGKMSKSCNRYLADGWS